MRIQTVIPTTNLPTNYAEVLSNMGCIVGDITTKPPADYPVKHMLKHRGYKIDVDGFLVCPREERSTFDTPSDPNTVFERKPCSFVQITLPEGWSSKWDVLAVERGTVVSWDEPTDLMNSFLDEKGNTKLRSNYSLITDQSTNAPAESSERRRHPHYAIPTMSQRFTFFTLWCENVTIWDHAMMDRWGDPGEATSLRTYNSNLSLKQKMEMEPAYKDRANAIIRQALPDIDNPFAYWGQDCSAVIAEIAEKFSFIEKDYYTSYTASAEAKPRFYFENFGYALFLRDAAWQNRDFRPECYAPRGLCENENPEFFAQMKSHCEAIVRKVLPDFEKPSAYWGQDCGQAMDIIKARLKNYHTAIHMGHKATEDGQKPPAMMRRFYPVIQPT